VFVCMYVCMYIWSWVYINIYARSVCVCASQHAYQAAAAVME
jgi:hypothetical protein